MEVITFDRSGLVGPVGTRIGGVRIGGVLWAQTVCMLCIMGQFVELRHGRD